MKDYKKYKAYIRSKEWAEKRKELFNVRGYGCEQCGKEHYLDVHHKTYDRLYNENLDDLQVLCKMCHLSKHDKHFNRVFPKSKQKIVKRKKKKYKISKEDRLKKKRESVSLDTKIMLLKSAQGRERLAKLGFRFAIK